MIICAVGFMNCAFNILYNFPHFCVYTFITEKKGRSWWIEAMETGFVTIFHSH